MTTNNWVSAFRALARVGPVAALAAACAGCGAEISAGYSAYPSGVYDGCMTDAFIATTDPVYYDGRASYYCGGGWYYRDGRTWAHYGSEPRELREHRMGPWPGPRVYEPPRGHPVDRPRGHHPAGPRSPGRR